DAFHGHDLNAGLPDIRFADFDFILVLDVIEHLLEPELFIRRLKNALEYAPDTKLIVSSGNIGFILTRLALLFGQFNYGKRGILDMTHTRLFTFSTLRRLCEQAGFQILEIRGVPGPFPLAIGDGKISRLLVLLNAALIR